MTNIFFFVYNWTFLRKSVSDCLVLQ